MAENADQADLSPGFDVMNDPVYDTNSKGKERAVEDSDTCRICRGEGSKAEPLFYPCKCSGSIKFVHQECLMEWLSHSQKKHCELCKTPFRFTKLYHPQMPSTVPLPVFLRQAAVHSFRSMLTWSRLHLVVFVWLGWLPWCMRTVWRGLFWIGDGGWINWQDAGRQSLMAQEHLDELAAKGTTPVYHAILSTKDAAASAVRSKVSGALPPAFLPVSPTLNFSMGEPIMFRLTKRIFKAMFRRSSNFSTAFNSTISANSTNTIQYTQRSPSWLSDFDFLTSLTRSSTLNNIIIDTLEGQLITLLIVVAFILLFLIREWVVQQQPGMNMGAGFNAGAVADGQRGLAQAQQPQLQVALRNDVEAENNAAQPARAARRPRMIARPRPRRQNRPRGEPEPRNDDDVVFGPETVGEGTTNSPFGHAIDADNGRPRSLSDAGPSNSTHRPSMPTREVGSKATELRRTLEERSRASDKDWPGVNIFMDLWNRAKNDPAEVLRIIDREGQNDDLAWIVAAMKRLEAASNTTRHTGSDTADDPSRFNTKALSGHHSDGSSDGWQDVTETNASTESSSSNNIRSSVMDEIEVDNAVSTEKILAGSDEAQPISPNALHNDPSLIVPLAQEKGKAKESSLSEFTFLSPSSSPSAARLPRAESESSSDSEKALPDARDGNPFRSNHNESEVDQREARSLPEALTIQEALNQIHPSEENPARTAAVDDTSSTVHAPQTLSEGVMEWLWGGVTPPIGAPEEPGEDDAHVVNNVDDEAPFVPVARGQPVINDVQPVENIAQDPEVVAAAAQAGIDPDPEAVEDGEDLEGVMELIGMQGPLAGLVQNGMFSAVLVSLTIFFGIWTPYIAGKLFLVFLANPVSLLIKMPLRWASTSADLMIDVFVFLAGCIFYWIDTLVHLLCTPVGWVVPFISKMNDNQIVAVTAKSYAESALERLARMFVATGDTLSESDIPVFSIIAHESLHGVEQHIADSTGWAVDFALTAVSNISSHVFDIRQDYRYVLNQLISSLKLIGQSIVTKLHQVLSTTYALTKINPLRISLDIPQRTHPLNYDLAYWNTKDRVLAIILGYLFFSLVGVLYLKISASLRETRNAGKVEGVVADVLYQAGGVMKVILIISIEMIVFPLYCGLLLDVALLPLFQSASVMSRITFTLTSPNTSLFVHWFIGTCYMFHFALFVSMCRKIMRSGVLYFIRDPDDPTFHPVRDVLERNVSTQLRKIAFSALVYGALVIVCLGTVVWGLSFAFNGVFPIHWSSNEPVLEFPVDLLFYNFLMPVAVKFFKPSKALNRMYDWWFRKCARGLRLTNFLFGEKREDEEGHLVHRSWWDAFGWKSADAGKLVVAKDRKTLVEDRNLDTYFLQDGHFVRAPASDSVRIPKGARTFVEVSENDERLDGQPETDSGLHGRQNKMFSRVYIPPFFRLRIGLFIFLIWLFAATTGLGITVVPLVFGRFIFTHVVPVHLRMNDIYAFSIGLYLLGGPLYLAYQYRSQSLFSRKATSHLLRSFRSHLVRFFRLLYFYTSLVLLLPSAFALMMELYLLIPLHTYFGGAHDRHIIHFIQDWTLGVLYIKMAGRLILWNETTRPAIALRAVLRNGWLDPDIRLATRSFIFPATVLMSVAIVAPIPLGWLANMTWFSGEEQLVKACVYRYAYPGVLAIGMGIMFTVGLTRAVRGWRARIRDEVYLIGERLHNFGEKRSAVAGGSVAVGSRVTTRG